MIRKALSGFSRLIATCSTFSPAVEVRIIFIVRTEHEEKFQLATLLRDACPGSVIVVLEHSTRGAVETCMAAAPHLDLASPLVICDCDHYVCSAAYEHELLEMLTRDDADVPEGLLVYMEHSDPRYSYCALDPIDGRTALTVTVSNFPTESIFKHLDFYWRATMGVIKQFVERSS